MLRTRYLALSVLAACAVGCRRDGEPRSTVRADTAAASSALRGLLPPRPLDEQVIRAALARADVRWDSATTAHLRLYAIAGTYAASHLRELGERAEAARSSGLALLSDPAAAQADYPVPLTLLFVPSRDVMRSFVGRPSGGMGIVREQGAFFVASDTTRASLRHELMHVLSWNLWGVPFGGERRGQWISEGLATVASGDCDGMSFHSITAAYARAGRLLPWASLEELDVRTLIAYAESGSVVQWVRERFGAPAVRVLWREGLPGLARATGQTPAALEAAWRGSLRDAPPLPRAESDLDSLAARIRREGCER